jgi:large subunit ribosomal protein L17
LRHGDKVKKLGRTAQHRLALMRNLVTALFEHERIRTTLPKAKECRRFADRMVTFALKNNVAARREVGRFIQDKTVLKKLFDVIGPRFVGRPGGFTRILQLGPREGERGSGETEGQPEGEAGQESRRKEQSSRRIREVADRCFGFWSGPSYGGRSSPTRVTIARSAWNRIPG